MATTVAYQRQFMAAYFKNEKCYKLQYRLVYSTQPSSHVTHFLWK